MATQVRMHKNQEQFLMHINQQANWTAGACKRLRLDHNFFMQINQCTKLLASPNSQGG
jgi:hypothetical protein